ncbi:hypothetical protein LTR85_003807 [Meristemomyces frigidus]|nr:hypothetical protein LTR85_003807 [Meristemomyces frigidus]
MAFRGKRSDDFSANSIHEASRSIFFRMAGGWGNVAGPGYFMTRIILSGTVSSAVLGLAGSAFGAVIWGTAALPFLISACGGFFFGAIGFYRDALRQANMMLERYPRLIQLHLDANYPTRGFLEWRTDQFKAAVFSRSWVLQSMLVCSWLTAQPALDQLMEHQEQLLVEEAKAEMVASAQDKGINAGG